MNFRASTHDKICSGKMVSVVSESAGGAGATELAFEPERLRLARELREWSQADLARRADLTPAAVSQFEGGVTRPSEETQNRLAAALQVPRSFLGLPLVETHEGFFRSLRRTSVTQRRKARALAHVAHDAAVFAPSNRLPPLDVPGDLEVSLDADRKTVEVVAARVRAAWGIPSGPVPDVVGLLESHGVVVIRLPLDTADVDAFSLPFLDRPVVVLCSDKNDRARSRFDAAHELGHLVLHGQQVWGMPEVEQQAHWFAAAFLMPAADIFTELPDRGDWAVLFDLKRKWQVSMAALLMRARALGRMSEPNYLTAIKAASARGWRRTEPVPLGEPEEPRLLRSLCEMKGTGAKSVLPDDALGAMLEATVA